MSRILDLQRLALDKATSLFGSSCSSSASDCCNGSAQKSL
ncbi:class III lanthipeptide [Oleiagrimonas soli]|uniref:Uncharacterized protein n=1 Tax=Oleiagrimonas soli TaxID=1543381 RepID=A0A841KKV1_9GAMM|nr:class III lanthipeptide [Oleiagrimonas soli]MBB6184419.1 hypothetical protein [Oleiagrimonas soli]